MMKPKPHPVLAQPMQRMRPGESPLAAAARTTRETIERLNALCDYYGIADDDPATKWFNLALALAQEHVPGFTIKSAPLPLPGKSAVDDLILVAAIEKAKGEGRSARNAAILLTKQRGGRFEGHDGETLRQRYYACQKAGKREGRRMRALLAILELKKL